jgi:hypothetical protein
LLYGFGRKIRQEQAPAAGVVGLIKEAATAKTTKGVWPMWTVLFAVATGASICLSVAAVVMQPAAGRSLHD